MCIALAGCKCTDAWTGATGPCTCQLEPVNFSDVFWTQRIDWGVIHERDGLPVDCFAETQCGFEDSWETERLCTFLEHALALLYDMSLTRNAAFYAARGVSPARLAAAGEVLEGILDHPKAPELLMLVPDRRLAFFPPWLSRKLQWLRDYSWGPHASALRHAWVHSVVELSANRLDSSTITTPAKCARHLPL